MELGKFKLTIGSEYVSEKGLLVEDDDETAVMTGSDLDSK